MSTKIKKRRLLLKFIELLVCILLFFFLFELILILVGYDKPQGAIKGLVRRDEITDFSLKPNFSYLAKEPDFEVQVNLNSDGFRDYEHNLNTKGYRIMAIGDSQTYGVGVEFNETFLYLLESKLRQNYDVEIFKMGVFAYGTDNEFYTYKKFYSKYKPNMVILIIHPNDVLDDAEWGEVFLNKKRGSLFMRFFEIHSFFRKTFKFYDFIYVKIQHLSIFNGLKGEVSFFDDYKSLFINKDTEKTKKGFDNLQLYLNKFEEDAKKNNFRFVVVLASSIHQFDDINLLQDYAKSVNSTLNLTKVNYGVKNDLDKSTFFIDTYNVFYSDGNASNLFLPVDQHWNQKGHEVAADFIYEKLIKNNLITIEKDGQK